MPDLEDTITEVSRRSRADEFPALTYDEVERAVTANALATVWTASTAYSYGDKVVPTVRDGRVRQCVVAGTSGATEPDWTDADYARDTDNTVTWEEAGRDVGLYDIRGAVGECLRLRALKGNQGGDPEIQAVVKGLREEADRHRSVGVA